MENEQDSHPFQFFAHVRLEDPSHFPNENEHEVLQRLMPLIRTLKGNFRVVCHIRSLVFGYMLTRGGKAGPQHVREFEGRFSEFVHEETNAWRQRGTERPAHLLLRPSGSIAAPIAHHLLNPTFYATDPYSNETDDASNPTIYLLHKNGFSSQNPFMFDQICAERRH
jgi:hypothetical protein